METHSKYTHLSNVPLDIFCSVPHAVVVMAGYSFVQDAIERVQTMTTCETLNEKIVMRQFAGAK
jgi:hypothetical protein